MVLHLTKLESPLPKDASWQVWLKLALCSGKIDFLNFVNVFYYFVIISPWKRAGHFICRKSNLLHSNCDRKSSHEPSAQAKKTRRLTALYIILLISMPLIRLVRVIIAV